MLNDAELNSASDKYCSRLAISIPAGHLPICNCSTEYTKPEEGDDGDFVVVVNASEVNVTGKKLDQKLYYRHSGYPGGIKSKPLREIMENSANDAIKSAVKGMLPKSKLGRQMFTKLKVYNDDQHPHAAQKPVTLDI